jgi:predicted small secreted protein
VKKIALTLVAVSALGLAACQPTTEANEAADTNTEATANEANGDTENALEVANQALESAGNAVEEAGNVVEEGAEAIENAAEDATK